MRVQVGGVLHVVAGAFQPANEVVIPGEKLPAAVVGVRPVPRDLHRARRARDGVRAVSVEVVEALAGAGAGAGEGGVVRAVGVSLVGGDGVLDHDVGVSRIVVHDGGY